MLPLPSRRPVRPLFLFFLFAAGSAAAQEPSVGLVLAEHGTADGVLTAEHATLASGEHVARYALTVSDGGPFEVVLTASDFDPYLILIAPSGAQYDNDDWQGARTEARVQVTAAQAEVGAWRVTVTTYAAGETGAYQLAHRALTPETYARALADADALARADSLWGVWSAHYSAGRYAEAVAPAREVLALREGALAPDHPTVARSVNDLAITQAKAGDFAEARDGYTRAIAMWEATLGPGHPDVAAGLNNLADLLSDQGDYAAARPLYERALALREAALGPDHPDVAQSLNNLAAMLGQQGDYDEARRRYERALAIREAAFGPDDPRVATTLSNLGVALNALGDFASARRHYERALALREAALGPDHLDVANSLGNLAAMLLEQGDYAAARPLFERALAIREATLGPDHLEVALSLNDLAGVLDDLGDYPAAQALHARALALREAALGPSHPDVAQSLNNLAAMLREQGDYAAARPLFERALALREAALGPDHPDVASALDNLAVLLSDLGEGASARPLRARALAIREAAFGADHPDVALSLSNLAVAAFESGEREASARFALRAARAYDAAGERLLPTLSAAEQRAFVDLDLGDEAAALLSTHPDGPGLRDAYAVFGGWKGLLLDGLRRQSAVTALASDPAYADDAARLRALRAQVARAYRDGDPALPTLTEEKERLERRLAAALPDGAAADPWRTKGLDGLTAALPPATAFADVFRYYDWTEGGLRYGAVVVAPGAAPVLVKLGPAEALEAAVSDWREAVTRGDAADTGALAAALWKPLAAALPEGTTRVWLSPDGDLVRVPWAVLAAEYEAMAGLLVAQIPSARALLTLVTTPAEREGAPALLLVGGVDFGAGAGFTPLPGTAAEVGAVAALADAEGLRATTLTGAAPTPGAVSTALPRVAYAHLATHGFFYGEAEAAYATRGGAPSTRTDLLGAPGAASSEANRNPLAESGLALAGANDAGGTLTAEELVGLDLTGTRLVVLSACETGRGAEVTGQGVLGLQASLTAAGARALVMSLWKVPDESTAALMAHFYGGLWERGLAPAEALRRAQAAVRSTPGWEAPVHWAAWVLSGDAF